MCCCGRSSASSKRRSSSIRSPAWCIRISALSSIRSCPMKPASIGSFLRIMLPSRSFSKSASYNGSSKDTVQNMNNARSTLRDRSLTRSRRSFGPSFLSIQPTFLSVLLVPPTGAKQTMDPLRTHLFHEIDRLDLHVGMRDAGSHVL